MSPCRHLKPAARVSWRSARGVTARAPSGSRRGQRPMLRSARRRCRLRPAPLQRVRRSPASAQIPVRTSGLPNGTGQRRGLATVSGYATALEMPRAASPFSHSLVPVDARRTCSHRNHGGRARTHHGFARRRVGHGNGRCRSACDRRTCRSAGTIARTGVAWAGARGGCAGGTTGGAATGGTAAGP